MATKSNLLLSHIKSLTKRQDKKVGKRQEKEIVTCILA